MRHDAPVRAAYARVDAANASVDVVNAKVDVVNASIDVWVVDLYRLSRRVEAFEAIISPDELARAGRFKRVRDRVRWTVARGALRVVLSRYLENDPAATVFGTSLHGKPHVSEPNAARVPHFNLSHSGDVAMIGVSGDAGLGIDVERRRDFADMMDVAVRVFTVRERSVLSRFSGAQRTLAFFNGWTRKESIVKALGLGFSLALDSFCVSMEVDEPARVLVPPPAGEGAWHLLHLEPRPGYSGALAIQGVPGCEVVIRDFDPIEERGSRELTLPGFQVRWG